jgi:hypothetical protein
MITTQVELKCRFGVDAVITEETANALAFANSGQSLLHCGLSKLCLCDDPQL